MGYFRCGLLLFVVVALNGCSTVGYYWQSAMGHMHIMWQRVDIDELLADDDFPDDQKASLALALKARRFASTELGLPDNDSYTQYVDTGQKYVVWNAFAAPEFSLKLKRWCFLFVGCVGYRGYYAESDAKQIAEDLAGQGYDTHVGGAIAYSTLGWFDDPVLNTFIHYPEANLAGLIFPELAHQQLYIKNDTAFNEGYASMIEIEGVRRWLLSHPESGDIERYRRYKQMRKHFVALVSSANDSLRELYASELPVDEKRATKRRIIEQLRQDYERRKSEIDGFKVYDKWFSKEINNARLASVATYEDYVPAFQQLLSEQSGDLERFYQAVRDLADLDQTERHQKLTDLAERAASGS